MLGAVLVAVVIMIFRASRSLRTRTLMRSQRFGASQIEPARKYSPEAGTPNRLRQYVRFLSGHPVFEICSHL
jgi:hypothetical protein